MVLLCRAFIGGTCEDFCFKYFLWKGKITFSLDIAALFFHWFTAVSILISWTSLHWSTTSLITVKYLKMPFLWITLSCLLEVGDKKMGGRGWREWAGVSSLLGNTFSEQNVVADDYTNDDPCLETPLRGKKTFLLIIVTVLTWPPLLLREPEE